MRFKTIQDILHVLKYLIVLLLLLNKTLTQSSVKLPVILFVLMMLIPSDDTHSGTKYNATIQCNITSEGASVAECDKNITTEINSKLISNGSLYYRIPPLTKGKAQLSQK